MNKFLETLKNIWKIEDLRKKILYTLSLVLIYRIGTFIVLPGIDPTILAGLESTNSGQGLLDLLNMFVGGSFLRGSVFALGIMPYISASIAMQLLTLAVPTFQKLQKEGESGRKKITQWTRILTIVVTIVQGVGYVTFLQTQAGAAIALENPFLFGLSTIVVLTAGTVFCMWLGEKITDRGIGNGISILIMIGIIATLPFGLSAEIRERIGGGGGLITLLIEGIILIAIVFITVMLVQGVRRIAVQYARRVVGNRQFGGVRQFIPLRVNASGVMPIIFAQALMFIPSIAGQIFSDTAWGQSLATGNYYNSFWYNAMFFLLIVLFTYFYTALIINPDQMADDMKRNNGFIPGVKPGKPTAEYIDNILSKITLPGSVFLGLIAILPVFARKAGVNPVFAEFFGGTSLLILVAVVLDTLQQVESHLLMRHYDGLMEGSSRIKVEPLVQ